MANKQDGSAALLISAETRLCLNYLHLLMIECITSPCVEETQSESGYSWGKVSTRKVLKIFCILNVYSSLDTDPSANNGCLTGSTSDS